MKLLYTNSQSSPFHVFHWPRVYHVRVTKLDCLPLDRIEIVVFQIKFNVINFRNKIFHVFSYVVHFSLSFLSLVSSGNSMFC